MENIMMLPASYCVMNEEEMTYTTGGASAIQAIAAWVFPPYAWLAGVTAIRDYRKKNPNTWTQDGLDYFANDMGKSVSNFLYDLACASWVLGTSATGIGLVINAALIMERFELSSKRGINLLSTCLSSPSLSGKSKTEATHSSLIL